MKPLSSWPLADRRRITGVFTDIDDTLTTDGAITPDALNALAALKTVGLHVIPITGRPVGWSVPFAQGDAASGLAPWPVDAIVVENGAVALFRDKKVLKPPFSVHSQLLKIYQQDAAARCTNFARMQQVAQRVLREVPGAQLSQDSPGRETDIAIDHSEFTHLPPNRIEQALHILRSEGLNATVSSIHINAWLGTHTCGSAQACSCHPRTSLIQPCA